MVTRRRMSLFASAHAKLQWATRHIDHLEAASTAYLSPLLKLHAHQDFMGHLVMRFLYRGQVLPTEFGLMIGDIATNLRAVLDHIVWALVSGKLTPDDRKEDVGFPFVSKPAKLKKRIETAMIDRVKNAPELIGSIRPYPGGDDNLYELHSLSNSDKHRLITVVSDFVELHRVVDPKGKRKPVDLNGLRLGTGPGLRSRLHLNGTGIVVSPDGNIDPSQFEKTFHLAFGEKAPFERKPVIPTLRGQAQGIRAILEKFEERYPTVQLSDGYYDDQAWRRR
ncbi:hypothetical protein [Bradyrhizobium sp. USDA 3364]